jgi:hypothetical protein
MAGFVGPGGLGRVVGITFKFACFNVQARPLVSGARLS